MAMHYSPRHLNFEELELAMEGRLFGERQLHFIGCRACNRLIVQEWFSNPFIKLTMAELTKQLIQVAQHLTEKNDFDDSDSANAQMLLSLFLSERKKLIDERDEWKRRAAQHGCNVDDGDPDCG